MKFSRRLKQVINSRGLTVAEFSALTDVPVGTLSSYLAGTSKPGLDNLVKIAHKLDMGVDWLLSPCVDSDFEMKL